MSQTDRIIAAVKRHLKSRGITYAALSAGLGLSLPTVKRLLSGNRLTLDRLEAICEVLAIDIADLTAESRVRDRLPTVLTLAQERALANEPPLLSVFHLLLNEWSVEDILAGHALSTAQCQLLLGALERLGLVEVHPGNRIRLRVSRSMRWRPNGPVVTRWGRRMVSEFIFDAFDGAGEVLRFGERQVSSATHAHIVRKLDRIAAEFEELADIDALLPHEQRSSVGFLVAMRPFALSVFEALPKATEPGSDSIGRDSAATKRR